jgi:glycosyltransferase involved in cell wall biosynthesis
MLELWVLTFAAEALLILVPPIWHFRRLGALTVMAFIAWTTWWLALQLGWAAGIPVLLLTVLRFGNLARILKGRMHEKYLHFAVGRTSWWLFVFYVLLAWLFLLPAISATSRQLLLDLYVAIQLALAVGLYLITSRNLKKLAYTPPQTFLTDRQLPTVTVAIPARNETIDLEGCLKSILANDYPKLEIIVLDDCSKGETADIIKRFAHDGVRFVQGDEPAERWLAKNQAYEKLYKEATGQLILFCGVDVRFAPTSIRHMVNVLQSRKKAMLSVLPVREQSSLAATFIQPMRYWWELALPRRLFNRPPVLSTCWLIKRSKLKKLGGFGSVCHAIIPEGYFARELVKTDEYSFIRSDGELDIRTVKSLDEQRKTALRMRYPQIRRRPEWAVVLVFADIVFLLLPFVQMVGSVWFWPHIPLLLPLLTCAFLVATHERIVMATNPSNRWVALWNFPFVVLTEIFVGVASMVMYEFFTVTWKDRNICIPVMHVIPHLPSLPPEVAKK